MAGSRSSGVRIKWTPEQVKKNLLDEMERRMVAAVLIIEEAIVQKVNKGQPVRQTESGNLIGLQPSAPGQPPKVVSGRLKQSWNHVVIRRKNRVIGRVGTDVVYDPRLELGFVGRDSLGRNYNQAPRPHIRPAFEETKRKAAKALVRII
jgi:hypothetical protein